MQKNLEPSNFKKKKYVVAVIFFPLLASYIFFEAYFFV